MTESNIAIVLDTLTDVVCTQDSEPLGDAAEAGQ